VLRRTFPEQYKEMMQQLRWAPTENIPGKLIQTRLDPDVREYKLPKDNRVLFILNFEKKQVLIGYAGRHLNKPGMDRQIQKTAKQPYLIIGAEE